MYAKIKDNKNVRNTLQYNEQKVREGRAECIAAGNFTKDLEYLTQKDKLYHFRRLTSQNENINVNGLHISLNFHPTDKLSASELTRIATEYMDRMDWGHQPYLIYRHNDAGHPHLHVATTSVQKDGKNIRLPWDYLRSRTITRELEQANSLVQVRERHKERRPSRPASKVLYGQKALMPALSDVLDKVVPQYKCTSVEELNAALRLYNVEAYRGKEGSRLHRYRGLIYRVLDENGRAVSGYIKASLFDSKPTLARLEKQFQLNLADPRRPEHKLHVQTAVDWALVQRSLDMTGLQKTLVSQRISMVQMKGKEAGEQSLYYVDHQTRAVFDGRQLGANYHGKGLEQRCAPALTPEQQQAQEQKRIQQQRGRDDLSLEL